ncbi:phage tail protein [Anaerobacillus sp. CMMVII]|uniref:phage tail spike protein n=1 Tax=Anaerobacillus sp. CMMVII TaxID=2755588 RepID=UPI0021B6F641|nr:phage tail spike protein [Anaerobacillus sp. CMMVII]MCT8138654.1 phage tail protein [Anaerobacillus sp. CMMVII]
MIKVFSKGLEPIGILENAYSVSVDKYVNEVWEASFTLPASDFKNTLCQHFNFIEITSKQTGRYHGLYRIMPTKTKKNETTNSITYMCEHVLSTLLDDVIEGYMQLTNQTTETVLQAILDIQEIKHWKLGTVSFTRYFHYKFENENGLLVPILSVPKPFNEPYEFTFDTKNYPWTINLVRPSNEVQSEIRWGKDMINFEDVSDPSKIVNFIIPKGAGEGVNQLTIESVNNGIRYLKDDESISKWGKRPYVWIDRRFEDAESLKASGQSLINQWKDPKFSFECEAADLSVLPGYEGRRKLGTVTKVIVGDEKQYEGRILVEHIPDLSKEYDAKYEINNGIDDIATTQADLERKQRVNEAYSQGATNILNYDYQDNCDQNNPATIKFFIDNDVVNINTCELTFDTEEFRAYSQATEGGGATVQSTGSGGGVVKSTSSGGGTTQTSSSGGGTSTSTSSGGGTSQTSSSGGNHRHVMFQTTGTVARDPSEATAATVYNGTIYLDGNTPTMSQIETLYASGDHSHTISVPNHSHDFSIPNHSHSVTIPNHTHEIDVPNHSHNITLPNHTHNIKHGIFKLAQVPTQVTIRVDGNLVSHTAIIGNRVNIEPYLQKENGKIVRGRHQITITPNGLGRINANLILRVFIQSHIGGNF